MIFAGDVERAEWALMNFHEPACLFSGFGWERGKWKCKRVESDVFLFFSTILLYHSLSRIGGAEV
jgi:hypothetical protein